MFCDDHYFVGGQNFHQGNDIPGFLCSVYRDDAFSAALLDPIIIDVGALPEASFGDYEEGGVALDDDHSDYGIALFELDAFDSSRIATHLADVLFMEANGQTMTCSENDVVRS